MTTLLRNAIRLAVLAALVAAPTARAATVTFDLWAMPGATALPGNPAVPIWGYATASAGPATVPGPVLTVTEGDTVIVNLNNGLAEATSLDFGGQGLLPDLVGAAAGSSRTYTFTAGRPGTFLYQAGPLPQAAHQAAMGLFGALVVRPAVAPGQAYADPATAFDDEAVLVLSEVDPALNAAPATFDLRSYAPKYYLINGQAFPGTAPIPSAAGRRLLLRYLNAGLQHHSMALLGMSQVVVATDGEPRTFGQALVAETVAPGQTMDTIATVPAGALAGSRFALHDGSLRLQNNTGTGLWAGFGGMLTFVTTSAAGGGAGTGPATSGVAVAPSPTDGSAPITVTATVTADVTVDPANVVTAAELFIDAPGAAGTGTAMGAADLAFDGASEAVTATIPASVAAGLLIGTHTVYVHGQDTSLAWGAFATATLTIERLGPTTGAVALAPNPTSGAASVTVTAGIAMAGGTVAAAEYFVDAPGASGAGTAMTGAFGASTVSATGTLTTSALAALASGNHTVYVHGRSGTGSWGAFNFAVLNLDKAGPTTSGPTLTPNPTGGTADVAVHATGDDSAWGGAVVVAAEYAIDGGAAAPMTVNVAAPAASLDAVIPTATVVALASGPHTVAIRSQDALGNWGAPASITLTVDRAGPTTSGVAATPNPANGTAAVRVTATVADDATRVVSAEGFIDAPTATPPAPGTGFRLIPSDGNLDALTEAVYVDVPAGTIAGLSVGSHTVSVRGQDAAGNWGALASASFGRSGVAVADRLVITSSTSSTPQQANVAAPGLLANDTPIGATGRTATLVSGPVRTSGTGTGTIRVGCGGSTATGVCANGSYRVTLTPTGTTPAQRQASKRGTYQFTYRMTLNGVSSAPATVTVTVN